MNNGISHLISLLHGNTLDISLDAINNCLESDRSFMVAHIISQPQNLSVLKTKFEDISVLTRRCSELETRNEILAVFNRILFLYQEASDIFHEISLGDCLFRHLISKDTCAKTSVNVYWFI